MPNEPILVKITSGEQFNVTTNAIGQTSTISYGPKGSAQTVNVTATVVSKPSVNTTFELAFVNSQPTMSLLVSPLSMSSTDYNLNPIQADVVVSVRDDLGNPISGQNITLTLDLPTVLPANWTAFPYLASPSLKTFSTITDDKGQVKTVFIPGSLTPGSNWEGSCVITANWTSNPSYPLKTATVNWSNKPYLAVYTNVTPNTVKLGDEFNVTLRVAVVGKNPPLPLTLMLDEDTSANMLAGNRLQEATSMP